MRDCYKCVYCKKLEKNKYYCMFFTAPSCPKGEGEELNFDMPIEKPKPVLDERPPYPPPYEPRQFAKQRSNIRENHYKIYKMRYEDMMLFNDIAKEFGVTGSAIRNYMSRCDDEWLSAGHKDWAQFTQTFKIEDRKQDGLTKDGNIPPFAVSKFATKHINSPLRKNHDKIFNLRKEGHTLSEIAGMLGLVKGSLYAYVERCESEWANKIGD